MKKKQIALLILIVLMAGLIALIFTIPEQHSVPRIIFSFILGMDVSQIFFIVRDSD